jgi:type III secretory pathway component EscT
MMDKFYFKNKKGQLFALELKELAIGFAVGFVVAVIVIGVLIYQGVIPISLLENLAPAAKK